MYQKTEWRDFRSRKILKKKYQYSTYSAFESVNIFFPLKKSGAASRKKAVSERPHETRDRPHTRGNITGSRLYGTTRTTPGTSTRTVTTTTSRAARVKELATTAAAVAVAATTMTTKWCAYNKRTQSPIIPKQFWYNVHVTYVCECVCVWVVRVYT